MTGKSRTLTAAVCGVCAFAATGYAGELTIEPIAAMNYTHGSGSTLELDGVVYVWGGNPGYTTYFESYDTADPEAGWQDLSPAPANRTGMGEFVLGDCLYFVGGEGGGAHFHNTVYRYCPGSGWTQMNDFPANAWSIMCAVVDGEAYAFGGRRGYGRTYSEMWKYDEGSDNWIPMDDMLVSTMTSGVAVHNGQIYVFGGTFKLSEQHSEYLDILQTYDAASNTWTNHGSVVPFISGTIEAVQFDGEVYLFTNDVYEGGQWGRSDTVHIFNPTCETWRELHFAPAVRLRCQNGIPVVGTYAYMTDFSDDSGHITDAYRVDFLRTLTVEPIAAMNYTHGTGSTLELDGTVYVWGGNPGYTTYFESYDTADPEAGWQDLSPAPANRTGMGEFVLGDCLYFVGGEGGGAHFHNTVYRYCPASATWTQMSNFPANAWSIMCAVVGGEAYAFGGRRGYGRTYSEMWKYDEGSDDWIPMADMPVSTMNSGVAVCDGQIHVFGGTSKESEQHSDYLDILQTYDPDTDTWTNHGSAVPFISGTTQAVQFDDEVYLFASDVYEGGQWVQSDTAYVTNCDCETWRELHFAPPVRLRCQNEIPVVNGYAYMTDFSDDGGHITDAYRVDLAEYGFTGDLNCDGEMDFNDIDAFVLALGGQVGYEAAYPNCRWFNADCNADGYVDFDDIDPFVELLGDG